MKRVTGIAALVLVASLLATSDVRGSAALVLAGKTASPSLTATVVTDVTGEGGTEGKGLTSIRIQKAGATTAATFTSGFIKSLGPAGDTFKGQCSNNGTTEFPAGAKARFAGGPYGALVDGWIDVDDGDATLNALLSQFGNPHTAALTDLDYAACTFVNGRWFLSFSGVIQFEK